MQRRNSYLHHDHSRSRRQSWSRQIFSVILLALSLVPFSASQDGQPQTKVAKSAALSPADRDKVIYVADFELDPENFHQDKGGITGKGYLLPAPPKNLRRKQQDRATAANNLIQLMSDSLVTDLRKSGLNARRISSTEARPTEGLLLSGIFTELSEGNQMRRALLGFGAGRAKMELYIMLADASSGGTPLYETSAEKSKGKYPGAMIALNPYAGAAGFVAKFGMTKNAPEKMVKKTASNIAAELTKQLGGESAAAKSN